MGGVADALFGRDEKKVRQPEPKPDIDKEGAEAAEKERIRRRRAGGRRNTILSGPLGVPGQATIGRKQLTGQ